MAIYGKNVRSYEASTGYVTIQNPEHGTLKVNKETGFVGEKITIENSMQENWYIKNYLINATKIEGATFSLTEGENILSAVEYYQEESASEQLTITLEYYFDDVLQEDLTETKTIRKGQIVRPSAYLKDINDYKGVSTEPISSFVLNSNTTIKLFYRTSINPFPKISVSYNQINGASGNIVIANNNDFAVEITSINGGVYYGDKYIELFTPILISANDIYTSETLNAPPGNYIYRYSMILRGQKFGTSDTYSSSMYSADINMSNVKVNVIISAYVNETLKGSYNIQVDYGSQLLLSTIQDEIKERFGLDEKEYIDFETSLTVTGSSIFPKADGIIKVNYGEITYKKLTITYMTTDPIPSGSSVPGQIELDTKVYNLRKGSTFNPVRDYDDLPTHYVYNTSDTSYTSNDKEFTLNSDMEFVIYLIRESYTITFKHCKGTSSSNVYKTTTQSVKYGSTITSSNYATSIYGYEFNYASPSTFTVTTNTIVYMFYKATRTFYTLTCKYLDEADDSTQIQSSNTYQIEEDTKVYVDSYRATIDGATFSRSSPSAGSSVTMTSSRTFTYYYNVKSTSGDIEVTASLSGNATRGYVFTCVVKNNTSSSITVNSVSSGCGISVSGTPATISSSSSKTFSGSSKFIFDQPTGYTCVVDTSAGSFTDTYTL